MKDVNTSKRNISNNTISIIVSFVFFLLTITVPQPFLQPILVYDYEPTSMNIWIKNNGFQPATDVLIEIIPLNGISINKITPSTSEGEIITEYSKNNTKIFHVQHIYNKDNIGFVLNNDQEINEKDVKVVIRSNEVIGIEAGGFWQSLIINLQIMLVGVAIVFGIIVFFFVSWLLRNYQKGK